MQQAIADLRAVAAETSFPIPMAITAMGSNEALRFENLRSTDSLLPASDDTLSDALWAAAMSPEEGADGAGLATAMLLGRAIEDGMPNTDFLTLWDVSYTHFARANPPVRAALMNGFRFAAEFFLADDTIRPEPAFCLTSKADSVIGQLLPFAHALDESQRQAIAEADRHSETALHLTALEAVLARPDCRMIEAEYWYPSEAVELAAFTPSNAGFKGALALILVNAIRDVSWPGVSSFHWTIFRASGVSAMDPAWRPFIAAFRHLYETEPEFELGEKRRPPPPPIPWFRS